MRLGTWNCQGGLTKKLDVVEALATDVLLVQECLPGVSLGKEWNGTSIWYPPYRGAPKGTGLYCSNGWSATWLSPVAGAEWVMPALVSHASTGDSFILLAVWTNKNKGDNRPGYAEQLSIVLDLYENELRSGGCFLAGDLNASVQGPSRDPHVRNLTRLADLGLVSAYHYANHHPHGGEPEMTLKWVGPGKKEYLYHCDFVFVPEQLAASITCSVVDTFNWVRRVSDHQPVVVDGLMFE